MHDTPPVNPDSIRASLVAGLPCDVVEVRGDGHHFEAVIVSRAFEGQSRVRRHRMRDEIHALSMRTLTPDEWRAGQGQ